MALTCCVKDCSNGAYWLKKWKLQLCNVCGCLYGDKLCTCEPPFRLFTFPTKKKNPETRERWKEVVGRQDGNKLWSPPKDSRVCSKHFVDSQPTSENLLPTLQMGYDGAEKLVKRMIQFESTRHSGLQSKSVFNKIHSFIAPYVNRRWTGVVSVVRNVRIFKNKSCFGPERKMTSKRYFLLGYELPVPDEESLIAPKPERFRKLPDLHSIIDCTEIFIETPKDLYLQSATWSDYKHNTLKVLIACTPNSSINFVSKAYLGRVSDKALTLDCRYLDQLPVNCMLMADKGFNIADDCATDTSHCTCPLESEDIHRCQVPVLKRQSGLRTTEF
ncbi:hypothetical protein ScPMuIL_003634 [Solemya velum]